MTLTDRKAVDNHRLSTLFYRNPHLLALSLLILIIAGFSALHSLPRIEDPRITNRNPIVLTLLPGASAARTEALVTKPLEDKLREVSEIKEIESTSRPGISLISLELEDWIDHSSNEIVFSKIRDKLADATIALPIGASLPEFDDKRGAVAYSLITAIKWDGTGDIHLSAMTRLSKELADRLRNLSGTENVRIFGGAEEEITITVKPDELAALSITSAEVAALIAAADAKIPAGVLRSAQRDVLIEIEGELDSVQRIANIPITENGSGGMVKLGDVATVAKTWQDPQAAMAYADGSRALFIAARVDPAIRIDQWALAARGIIDEFASLISGGITIELAFDQSRYTEARLADLGGNLLAGAFVVILVVFLGMGWRAALIVSAALPLSAAFALFGLTLFGQQIHQMTIFGMIIAIGLLIDNAIVITDEVHKHLQAGENRQQAVASAVRHLFTPLLASTLTTIFGFMPIFLLPGNVGDFVGPIAISVLLALIGSFFVSMTLIAALAGRFATPATARVRQRWWRVGLHSARLAEHFQSGLLAAVQRPWLTLPATLLLPLLGFGLSTTLGNQFFPPADRDQFEVEVRMPNDTSLAQTARIARDIEEVIRAENDVQRVDWMIGGSFPSVYYNLLMEEDNETSYAHGIVVGHSVKSVNAMIPRLQSLLDERFPQAQIVVSPFGQGPPYEAPVAFRILGPNPAELKRYGEELRRLMHKQSAILHTRATIAGGDPKLWFIADEQQARLAGLTLADVAGQFQTNLEGSIGGSMLEDLEQMPVRIRFDNDQRRSLDRMRTLNLISTQESSTSGWIPAEAIGTFELRPELASITRRNGERVNKVLGYVTQGTLPIEVTRAILSEIDSSGFKPALGYRIEIAGDSEEQGRAIAQLATYAPVLFALIIATLVLAFRSFKLAAVIGAVAVLSIGLGMLSLWISGFPLGFNPILGSAGLVGVAINGAIVVLAAIRANADARAGNAEAIVAETLGTTRHILSTTLTTVGGFLPLLLFTGGNFWPPLAVVIAGGVCFSVILSLLFTPAIYYGLQRRKQAALKSAPESATTVLPLS